MTNPVVGLQAQMPTKLTPLTVGEEKDILAPAWYALLRALFERTGGGNGIPIYNTATLSDAGASQATATPLAPILNFVTASGKGVVMPAAMGPGEFLIVVNTTAGQALKIYPASGVQIDALGANAPYVTANGRCLQIFWFATARQCYSTKLG
jgi:hypothetical protein